MIGSEAGFNLCFSALKNCALHTSSNTAYKTMGVAPRREESNRGWAAEGDAGSLGSRNTQSSQSQPRQPGWAAGRVAGACGSWDEAGGKL